MQACIVWCDMHHRAWNCKLPKSLFTGKSSQLTSNLFFIGVFSPLAMFGSLLKTLATLSMYAVCVAMILVSYSAPRGTTVATL